MPLPRLASKKPATPQIKKKVSAPAQTEEVRKKTKKASLELDIEPDEDDYPIVDRTKRLTRRIEPIDKKPLRLSHDLDDLPEEPKNKNEDNEDDDGRAVVRTLPGVKKASLRRFQSMFGQKSDVIIDLLDVDDADGALSLISKTLLQTLVDVLPVVERNVRRSRGSRGVVPLNQVIAQLRELCNDIQAHRDKGLMGQTLVDRFIRPRYLDLAVQISGGFTELENGAKSRMSKEDFEVYRKEFLMVIKTGLATYMRQQYEDMQQAFVKALG